MRCYVLTSSLQIVHKLVMVPLYPRLLSECLILATPEAEDVRATGLFWSACGAQQRYLAVNFCTQLLK